MTSTGSARNTPTTAPVKAVVSAMSGPAALIQGFGMWRRRPGLMLWGAVPALIVSVLLIAGLIALLATSGDVVTWLTPFLNGFDEGLRSGLRWVVRVALVGGYLFAAWLSFVALTLLVGDPFYAKIARETEVLLGGPVPDAEVATWRSITDALKLLARSMALAVVVIAVGLLPVVGTVVAAVGGACVAGWLLADELLARPLEARGMDADARKAVLAADRWRVLGFGLSVQVFFLVPFGAVAAMPAAVVGATRLARDLLGEDSVDW